MNRIAAIPIASVRRPRGRWLAIAGAAVVGVPALIALFWFFSPSSPHVHAEERRRLRNELAHGDEQARKEAAWRLIEEPDPIAESFLVQGLFGAEESPDVREAFVYTLGRLGHDENLGAVEHVIALDPDGYVRAGAWLALARLAPERVSALVEQYASRVDTWDRIGMAQAQACSGDASGYPVLLRFAVDGDAGQREVASRALTKWVRPVLESVGRWPLDAVVHEGEIWPAELVAEIEGRCGELDLRAAAKVFHAFEKPLARARRHADRVLRVREELAAVLFKRSKPEPAKNLP